MAEWIITGIAIVGLIFNSGVTYNHINELTKRVEELTEDIKKLDDKVDKININLARVGE